MADTTKQQADQSFFVFVKDTNTGRIRRMAIPADVQIGLQDNPAELQLLGRLSLAARDYSITAANQGILYIANDDTIISVSLIDTPTSGRITLYLPANPRNGQLHFIKDMSGTADSVPIDVVPSPGAMIDQFASRTLTDKFGSIALYWFGDRWRILVSGLGLANIGAADAAATYVTLSGNATLANERRLNVSGTNLTMVDQGPNASVVLDLSQILGSGAGTFTYATVTADAFGRITAISAGANPPPNNASYITVTNEPGLSAERALVAGTGILLQDGGVNTGITASVNNSVVATLTGSNFTGRVTFEDGVSGSIQRTHLGLSYLVAGPGITIFTQSNGQIIIGSPWTNNGTSLMTTSSVSIDDQGRFPASIGSDVYFFVSGTIGIPSGTVNVRRIAAFGGDVRITGSLTVGTGSVTVTGNDVQFGDLSTRIERQGADLKFFDVNNPQGQTLTSLIGGGGGSSGGDPNASYVVLSATGSLTNERVLAAGAGISITDNGPGNTVVISNTGDGGGADVSASYVVVGDNTGSLPNERRLAAGDGILITDNGPGNSVVISATGTSGSQTKAPIFSVPILAGTHTTNTATSGSKQSIGAFYFNPAIINAFGGTRNYFWRAIVDTSETLVPVAVDLYDVAGIVRFPPGIITGSIMSSSNLTMTQLQANLTPQLLNVTGSGIIEARLWKVVSGSLTSSVTCRNARLDVEFT